MEIKSNLSAAPKATESTPANVAPTEPSTALVPYVGPLQRPADGTVEATRFRINATDMLTVAQVAETNPKAIVLWDGVERFAGDLVKAWRKATYTAESKRLHRK